jgi:hypothetical protein
MHNEIIRKLKRLKNKLCFPTNNPKIIEKRKQKIVRQRIEDVRIVVNILFFLYFIKNNIRMWAKGFCRCPVSDWMTPYAHFMLIVFSLPLAHI